MKEAKDIHFLLTISTQVPSLRAKRRSIPLSSAEWRTFSEADGIRDFLQYVRHLFRVQREDLGNELRISLAKGMCKILLGTLIKEKHHRKRKKIGSKATFSNWSLTVWKRPHSTYLPVKLCVNLSSIKWHYAINSGSQSRFTFCAFWLFPQRFCKRNKKS